jgi:hypothetical protein
MAGQGNSGLSALAYVGIGTAIVIPIALVNVWWEKRQASQASAPNTNKTPGEKASLIGGSSRHIRSTRRKHRSRNGTRRA